VVGCDADVGTPSSTDGVGIASGHITVLTTDTVECDGEWRVLINIRYCVLSFEETIRIEIKLMELDFVPDGRRAWKFVNKLFGGNGERACGRC
jgi:hypothetical protein